MKFNSKLYAKSLILALKTNTNKERIIFNFINLLKKNNDIYLIKKILNYTEKILLQEEGKKKIIIETARPQKNLIFKMEQFFNPQKYILEERINPKLIAGIRILVGDEKQLDFSLKRKVNKLFKTNVF